MVFAEFIIAAFGLPVDFLASWWHGWKMGKTLCIVTGFILTTTGKFKNLKKNFLKFSDITSHFMLLQSSDAKKLFSLYKY